MTIRNYHFSFDFRVGGRKSGYDCHIEVKAATKKGAAQKIRNRIRKEMPDVATMPVFSYHDVVRGLPCLISEGHTRAKLVRFARPGKVMDELDYETKKFKKELRTEEQLTAAAIRRRAGHCSSF